jgi:hypothetical protein
MGIKKDGKRLLKLGQKAAKRLGEEGKNRVAEFFAQAIEILERELEKQRDAGRSKPRTSKAATRPRGQEAVRRATRAKPPLGASTPRKKPSARAAPTPRRAAARPVRATRPAKAEPHGPTPAAQPDMDS